MIGGIKVGDTSGSRPSTGWVEGLCLCCLIACSRTGIPELRAVEEVAPLCIELPRDGQGALAELTTDARLRRADVFFLLDSSGSMGEEIDAIRRGLRERIAPLIGATFPDVEYGVGGFSDFPLPAFGYGELGDSPFTLVQSMTRDLSAIQSALSRLREEDGLDEPEAQVEALYQLATGEGLGSYVLPSLGCPRGGFGAACFRDGARPVVLLFTDAPFHEGPRDVLEYRYLPGLIEPTPHSYGQALLALKQRGASVIGMWSGSSEGGGRTDLSLLARDTGALDDSAEPLVFDIGRDGEHLTSAVVQALRDFAVAAVFDVTVEAEDPLPLDGIDVTAFVASIRPVRAEPAAGILGVDEASGAFLGVTAGTSLTFAVELKPDAAVQGSETLRLPLRLVFRGDRRFVLDEREVILVIPGADGGGCDEDAGVDL